MFHRVIVKLVAQKFHIVTKLSFAVSATLFFYDVREISVIMVIIVHIFTVLISSMIITGPHGKNKKHMSCADIRKSFLSSSRLVNNRLQITLNFSFVDEEDSRRSLSDNPTASPWSSTRTIGSNTAAFTARQSDKN